MRFVKRFALALATACALMPAAYAVTYVVPSDGYFISSVDAIVVAETLATYTEESPEGVVSTVAVLRVKDVLKGGVGRDTQIEVRVPGGRTERHFTMVSGMPKFEAGDESLVFLRPISGGRYAVADLGLGAFRYETDDTGRRVLIRSAGEIAGWDPNGQPHREQRRDAKEFVRFIRERVSLRPSEENYFAERRPLLGAAPAQQGFLKMVSNSFTVMQYTIGNTESSVGCRWKTFPRSWNRGNSQPNAANSGIDAINIAFASWNNDASSNITYTLSTANANLVGADDFAADSVNNVVFEKNMLGTLGVAAYNCANGGVLGYGGVTSATGNSQNGDSTNTVGAEQFFSTGEADVSMNQNIGTCLAGAQLSASTFNSAVTHEFGHTLGLRHADKTRDGSSPCSTPGTYDCSSSAIMTAFVTAGLNGALQAWDQRAIAALYPGGGAPPSAPTGLVATAATSTSVGLSWTSVAAATSYDIYRKAPGGSLTFLTNTGSTGTTFTDLTAAANTAYLYSVRAKNANGTSGDSNLDLATTVIFTDDALSAGISIKALHLSQLRTAVNAVRAQAGLAAATFTDSASAGVPVKAVHLSELRNALDAAAITTVGGYTDASLTGVGIKAIHFQEIRNRVK